MAANYDISGEDISKQINLDPMFMKGESERGLKFWNRSVIEMKFVIERLWLRIVRRLPKEKKPDYGMETMDPVLEELTGNKLELVGPIVDGFLKEIGAIMESKLATLSAPHPFASATVVNVRRPELSVLTFVFALKIALKSMLRVIMSVMKMKPSR